MIQILLLLVDFCCFAWSLIFLFLVHSCILSGLFSGLFLSVPSHLSTPAVCYSSLSVYRIPAFILTLSQILVVHLIVPDSFQTSVFF